MQISYYSVLTKIQKLQNFKKKKKNILYWPVRPVLPEIGRYGQYEAGTAGIFSGTKQGGRTYRIAGRYGIFRPYRPVRYGIDNLGIPPFPPPLFEFHKGVQKTYQTRPNPTRIGGLGWVTKNIFYSRSSWVWVIKLQTRPNPPIF